MTANRYNQILLTGATGALGPALAAELLRTHAAERIAILMRATPAELPGRFERWLGAVRPLLNAEDLSELRRLVPAGGDICEEQLGLGSAADAMQRETDMVIHAAADTNFAAPHDR